LPSAIGGLVFSQTAPFVRMFPGIFIPGDVCASDADRRAESRVKHCWLYVRKRIRNDVAWPI